MSSGDRSVESCRKDCLFGLQFGFKVDRLPIVGQINSNKWNAARTKILISHRPRHEIDQGQCCNKENWRRFKINLNLDFVRGLFTEIEVIMWGPPIIPKSEWDFYCQRNCEVRGKWSDRHGSCSAVVWVLQCESCVCSLTFKPLHYRIRMKMVWLDDLSVWVWIDGWLMFLFK